MRIYLLLILLYYKIMSIYTEDTMGLMNRFLSLTSINPINTIDLYEVENKMRAVKVSIGYPPQKFLLMVDISSEYTWVIGSSCEDCGYSKTFVEKDSETLTLTNTTIQWNDGSGIVRGEIAYDYVNIKILSANNLPFVIVKEDYYLEGVDGVLGLGYGGTSVINFSILDKLYDNNQIKSKIFSIQFHDVINTSISLGRIPDHIQNEMTNLTYCHVNSSLHKWNCRISHLLVGEEKNFYKALTVQKQAIFSSTVNDIIMHPDYIQFFLDNYFSKYPQFESKFCYVKPDGKKFSILCSQKFFDINKAPSLHLIMNGWAYKIPPQDLFQEIFSDAYNQYYCFKILFTETSKDKWILGINFLKQYEIVFNKEINQVGFFGGSKLDFTKFTGDPLETICLYNYGVYAFIFCLVAFSMAYIIQKRKKENEIVYRTPNYCKNNGGNPTNTLIAN